MCAYAYSSIQTLEDILKQIESLSMQLNNLKFGQLIKDFTQEYSKCPDLHRRTKFKFQLYCAISSGINYQSFVLDLEKDALMKSSQTLTDLIN